MNFQPPDNYTSEEIAEFENVLPPTPELAYAEGRADQLEEDKKLLSWAYSKLVYRSFDSMTDALVMDEIKLLLMGGA